MADYLARMRRAVGRVVFETAPEEPGLLHPAEREKRIQALDEAARRALLKGDRMSMDAWLEEAAELRAQREVLPAPVIPGPAT
ncbi:hypothetical protein OWR29_25450 [Actinoplanes sp. Pm04-4]|uniref:Uncharacterized protein n=1 Tax=Paractinoplanes pyxinae TaxID=2997416 RepID=A0ABT4B6Y3_9ACTN|nr:hypothetical protein [Actinoplanes pyxinae]MCY1141358.1 hypothetical protein [Actinoplanes pyxinae]